MTDPIHRPTARPRWLRRNASALVSAVLILGAYGFARPPHLGDQEHAQLAARFAFTPTVLPDLPGATLHRVREVSPNLEHISGWISAVGASLAINDLDGDGLANDLCWVDVRVDRVLIAPAPGTGARFPLTALDPAPLRYDHSMAPMGCLPGDMNEDGRTDLLVYYWGRSPIAFLRRPDGGFTPREIDANGEHWYTNAATFADIDGDGHPDLIIGNYFPDGSAVLNPNSTDAEAMQHSMSRAFNAGKNRLLLWQSAQAGEAPRVSYRDASDAFDPEVVRAWTLAVGAADLDGDLLPEIYFGNDFGPDRLLHNRSTPGHPVFARLEGERGFALPASAVIGSDSYKGMGADFGDINGDGMLDIYVSNIATPFGLQESHFLWLSNGNPAAMREGRAPYEHGAERLGLARSGWGWDSRLADFDNDGVLEAVQATGFLKGDVNRWPELQSLGTSNDELLKDPRFWPKFQPGADLSGHEPNAFFVRAADGRYYDLAAALGLDDPVVTRAVAIADVDGDGDLDFGFGNQWEPSVFFRNDCPDCRRSLQLRLLLPLTTQAETQVLDAEAGQAASGAPARPAIGASARVHLPDGHMLVAQVDGGNGHSGSRAPELHFGLGDLPTDAALRVDLHWRDAEGARHQQTLDLAPGRHSVYLGSPNSRS